MSRVDLFRYEGIKRDGESTTPPISSYVELERRPTIEAIAGGLENTLRRGHAVKRTYGFPEGSKTKVLDFRDPQQYSAYVEVQHNQAIITLSPLDSNAQKIVTSDESGVIRAIPLGYRRTYEARLDRDNPLLAIVRVLPGTNGKPSYAISEFFQFSNDVPARVVVA